MPQALRIAGLTTVGVLGGVCAAFVNTSSGRLGPVPVPFGLILGLSGLVALVVLVHVTARSRIGVVLVSAGWLAPVYVLSQKRAAGDVVIAGDGPGLVLLFGGVIVIGIGLGFPPAGRRPDSGSPGSIG
jgi:hypothetical protein